MNLSELVFATLLVTCLLALGGYYSWRQVQLLRRLPHGAESAQERSFLHAQAIRRLVCSILILVFAGLLCGSYLLEAIAPEGKPTPDAVYVFSAYWIVAFLLFLAILALAAIDVLATRRFTLRQLRQLHQQHDELLAQQAARLRGNRNGR